MSVKELGAAIAARSTPPAVAFLGFDLWLETYATGKVRVAPFKKGGVLASGDEPEGTITAPIPVVGANIVISFDPTLPPDGFRLAP